MGHGVAAADADPGAPDGAAPTLVGSEPADGASDVAVGSLIVAHFSEAMLGSSLNTDSFQLVTDAGALLPGTVTASGADATFQASAPLPAGTAITASINWCAEDVAQNELTHSVAWSFTTAP
ncbi:MAG TPA: Ig-like domain-containing protein [Myxococcota bacterium]